MRPTLVRIPFSHYCRKSEWTLSYAGIAYDTVDVMPWRMPRMVEVHPEGTVPVLLVDDVLIAGSEKIMDWAASRGFDAYPKGAKAWQVWADKEIGPVARREAYRCAYNTPTKLTRNPAVWVACRAARGLILNILKFYKVRRYDDADQQAVPAILKRVSEGLAATGTGHLVGARVTAADLAVAALLVPLLKIRNHPCQAMPEWAEAKRFVDHIRPKLLRKRRRRVGDRDWDVWKKMAKSS